MYVACVLVALAMDQQGLKVMLLCGSDLLATMEAPGVWRDPEALLQRYGVVALAREGTNIEQLLSQSGGLLARHRDCIHVVVDPVPSTLSSSKVRQQLKAGRSVRYLLPDIVLEYIQRLGLYQ